MSGDIPVDSLSMDELRRQRMAARRAAEFWHLRARQGLDVRAPDLAELDAQVRVLTDELIARYAADLTLVDSLLDPAYPAGDRHEGRAAR